MTYTADDLAPLKEALLSGALTITANGRTITFRTQQEILSLIEKIEAQIFAAENPSVSANPRKIKATWSK